MLSLYTICLYFCFLWRKCFSDAWNSRGTLYMYIHMHVFVFFVFFQWSKFFSDPWSLFDLLVVAVSLISLVYICVLHLFVFSLYCVFSLYMCSLSICFLSMFVFSLYMCPLYIECVLSVCHFLDFLVVAVSLISLVYIYLHTYIHTHKHIYIGPVGRAIYQKPTHAQGTFSKGLSLGTMYICYKKNTKRVIHHTIKNHFIKKSARFRDFVCSNYKKKGLS